MLQIKSFPIKDGEAMSEFLKKNILHGKSSILISEGMLAIPYEDGEAPNNAQLILQAMEDKNMMNDQLVPIIHSQKVLEKTIEGITKQIEALDEKANVKTGDKKADYTNEQECKKEIKRLENVRAQSDNQRIMNQAEITRITINLDVYDETIAKLKAEK